ncbi:MAG: SDR family NAD(P)-dependent oxidoreductase [Dermatophilaceae bacterium]
MSPVAVVTGGGSGIGAATAAALVRDGLDVVVCGRRADRLQAVAADLGAAARAVVMDVTDPASVAAAVTEIGECDVLVNNAGGAIGLDRVENGDPAEWRTMYESNVLGVLHVTQAFLPLLRRSPTGGTIVVVSSTAGLVVYEGGGGYTAAKHAASAVTETLRLELVGEPIRVIEVDPGMVHTEGFSLTRFHGDQGQADTVYADVDRPLVAADVAECISFCVRLPQHVNVDRLVVKPVAQAAAYRLHRGPIDWQHRDG